MTYYHPDHLSNRLETGSSGAQTRTVGHLPFGDTWYETGMTDQWKFTTYERDGESDLVYAIYRSYTSRPDSLPFATSEVSRCEPSKF